jgi:hypothetical protein
MMLDLLEKKENFYYLGMGMVLFIMFYGLLSYLGASHTTTVPYNMGVPVADYTGESGATYIANVAISVPLTIIIVWLLLHLIRVLFKIDLFETIKRVLNGNPIVDVLEIVDNDIEKAEVKTATFVHKLKTDIINDFGIKPYRKSSSDLDHESFVFV